MLKQVIHTDGYNSLIKGKHGYFIYNRHDTFVGKSMVEYGEYSEYESLLFQQLCKTGDIVIEVGANIGTHTVPLAQMVGNKGRIFAFEPQRILFQTLCGNLAINSISNVDCYPFAVGSDNGHVLIPDIQYDRTGNFGGIEIQKFDSGYQVPVINLDSFLKTSNLKLLKVDVEGMEYAVISGAAHIIQSLEPILYVENDRREKSKELIELIWSLGYKIYWHSPPLFAPDNFAESSENVFGNLVSLNILCLPKKYAPDYTGEFEVTDSSYFPGEEELLSKKYLSIDNIGIRI